MKATFRINTAITGISPENGTYIDRVHTETVLPLRGELMQLDGMTGCNIGRYDMSVEFLPEVVDLETVISHVDKSITQVIEDEVVRLFPHRGQKTPKATYVPEPKSTTKWLVVRFSHSLTRYFPETKKQDFDGHIFSLATENVAKDLVDCKGVLGYQLWLDSAGFKFDMTRVGVEELQDHVKSVLMKYRANRDGGAVYGNPVTFFPYLQEGEELVLTFEVVEHIY